MDAAGARALAQRIQEEQARIAERESAARSSVEVAFTPPPGPTAARQERRRASSEGVEIAQLPARQAADRRDIRLFTKDVSPADVDGRQTRVAVTRCRALVNGRWVSRIVEVEVEKPDLSG